MFCPRLNFDWYVLHSEIFIYFFTYFSKKSFFFNFIQFTSSQNAFFSYTKRKLWIKSFDLYVIGQASTNLPVTFSLCILEVRKTKL